MLFKVTPDMRSPNAKTAALAYVRAGWNVLAVHGVTNGKCDCGKVDCSKAGKHPIVHKFPRGFKSATLDVKLINEVWTAHPNANVAIVPNEGLLVLDIDGHSGEEALERYKLPPGASVTTSRGRHLYFRTVRDVDVPKLAKVDVRQQGNGYVVAPPSRHISGKVYEWNDGDEIPEVQSVAFAKKTIKVDFSQIKTKIRPGNRNNELTSLAGFLRSKQFDTSSILKMLNAANRTLCVEPLSASEVRSIAFGMDRYDRASAVRFRSLGEINVEPINWLFEPYIPRGCVTILDGKPEQGKSFFAAALVAAITSGVKMPWSETVDRGRVLMLSAEDDAARVLKPRLLANGADLNKDIVRFSDEAFAMTADGLAMLEREIGAHPPDLVIIDPIVAYMREGADMNDAAAMTAFVGALDEVARRHNCAIVLIRHLRKAGGDAISAGMGSMALTGRARSVLVLGRHPDDREIRAVAHSKSNFAKEGPTITFALVPSGTSPVVEWRGVDANIYADTLSNPEKQEGPGRPPKKSEEAEEFLRSVLDDGPMASVAVKRAAKKRNISMATLRRVAGDLNIVYPTLNKVAHWKLPDK